MSVRERLEDAQRLFQMGRTQGALLSVLVAVAATSRKRRPLPERDGIAFKKFVAEETLAITGGAVLNFFVRFRGREIKLEDFLYRFVRCELAHEARLPDDVEFADGAAPGDLAIDVSDSRIAMSNTWMDGLGKAVHFAPENTAEFPDVPELPDDVVMWFVFGKRRNTTHVPGYWARRCEFAAAWQSRQGQAESCLGGEVGDGGAFAEIRKRYPNAYKRWAAEEDRKLGSAFRTGDDVETLARRFDRQPNAIRSRLQKLGLIHD